MSQWLLVDDADTAITYNTVDPATPWSAVNKSIAGIVDLDNAILQTGHVLSSNGSLSFSFTGTDIEVFGVSSKLDPSQENDISDLSWTCSIDNISIPANRTALRGFPWTSYCSHTGLNNEPHVLLVNVSMSESSQFWLDYIRFVPLPGPLPANRTLLVESTDHSIQYGAGWEPLGTAQITEPLTQNAIAGSSSDSVSMNFTFSGTGITWYSLTLQAIMQTDSSLTGAFPSKAGSALITVDGVPRNVTIPINRLDNPSYDMPLFDYDGLDPAVEHVLTATYMADTHGVRIPPLTLDFLLVQTGPEPAAGPNAPGVPFPSATLSSTSPAQSASPLPPEAQALSKGSHGVRASTIAGAVLGPLLFVLAALLAVCYWRRSQRTRTVRWAMTHPAAKLAFAREERDAPSFDETQAVESESYAMYASDSTHDYVRTARTAPGVLAGSSIVEDRGAAPAAAIRPLTPREQPTDDSWETAYPAALASAGAQPVLVDYSGRAASQSPSSASIATNPFRRLNLASPSNASFSTQNGTTSNPFRGGSLTPSTQLGG
ncbi:hypothetical protein HYPSUDRAFT_200804 [Hypholoma sublateritium FD-334 SS-4]|uniref:Uncharacterized protein n=1 Tax=Hypholoma sublateritium (strain FD-334 SS-4) TaxID=945553 RepID=A0A0D2P6N7_HYPSF|nr:hypothetical protein HYPSUDRAFT_200804 [Hypholoma sublateritium FD-334 SS-4]